jgi:hypothetical protein
MGDGTLYLICTILMLPNILGMLIPILMHRNTPPALSYIFSLTLNIGYGLLYGINDYDGEALGFGCAFILTVMISTFCFCDEYFCSTSFHGNRFVYREISKPKLDRNGFIRDMCGNRALPPLIQVYAEAYHFETRVTYTTTRDAQGNVTTQRNVYQEKVVTYSLTKVYKYASWEERGNSIRIKETDIIHAVCPYSVHLDDQAKRELEELRLEMFNIARTRDLFVSVSNTFTVPNLKEIVTGSISKEEPCVISFYQGICGKFFWYFFFFIGYQCAYEAIWCAQGERMRMKLKKYVSGHRNTYRCAYGAEDPTAAMSTFRFDNNSYALDSSLYTGLEQPILTQNMSQQGHTGMQYIPTQPGMQSMPGQQGMPYIPTQPGMQSMPGQQEMPYIPTQPGIQQPLYPDEVNEKK